MEWSLVKFVCIALRAFTLPFIFAVFFLLFRLYVLANGYVGECDLSIEHFISIQHFQCPSPGYILPSQSFSSPQPPHPLSETLPNDSHSLL